MLWEILEITGTIAFAAAGSLVGIKKRLDIFGVAMLAVTTAVGGGIIRDTLLGNVPPLAFRNPTFILLSLLVAILVSVYATSVARRKTMLTICDAVGLGAFTVTGASLALSYDSMLLVVALGVMTGIGGGVLRDMFVREIPLVFHKEIYAIAAAIGAIIFYELQQIMQADHALYPSFIIIVTIRLISVYYGINLPRARVGDWGK
jgi:uncharacterized membrane protein YeiH